jgi:3'-phosphoadenosine 5'-phosphosulfate sulfotransferase (PAPS reductase)/FAD synthetase
MGSDRKHVVMFSGGIGSWAAAKRVAAAHGTENMILLFADTLIEDEELYVFLEDAARNVGAPLVRVADGRTPWELFEQQRMIGNSRADLCSRILKREVADRWLEANCDPANTTIYLGIDWSESHRFDDGAGRGAKHRFARAGWHAEAPMNEAPLLSKLDMLAMLADAGIPTPRMYGMGFAHHNCGGFCIKAGNGQFAMLLEHMPVRYIEHELAEEKWQRVTGKKNTVLRHRQKGKPTRTLSLRQLRERIQGGGEVDRFDIGGCGCFMEDGRAR